MSKQRAVTVSLSPDADGDGSEDQSVTIVAPASVSFDDLLNTVASAAHELASAAAVSNLRSFSDDDELPDAEVVDGDAQPLPPGPFAAPLPLLPGSALAERVAALGVDCGPGARIDALLLWSMCQQWEAERAAAGRVAELLGGIDPGAPIPARVATLLAEARLVDSRLRAGEAPPLSALERMRVSVIDRLHEFNQAAYCPWTDEVRGCVSALRGVLADIDIRLRAANGTGGDDLKEGDSIYV